VNSTLTDSERAGLKAKILAALDECPGLDEMDMAERIRAMFSVMCELMADLLAPGAIERLGK